jgi:sugar O-acyltransferase (sialic acid O-acetyltransferase NeuD family)
MIDTIIIGAGGHAAEIDEYIKLNRKITGIKGYNIVGFLDDNSENYKRYKLSAPLLGTVKDHKIIQGVYYIIGIAGIEYRRPIIEKFKAGGGIFATIIHYNAYMSESGSIGEGTIIGPNANIGPNVKVGNFTLINARSSLGHDTIVGDYNFISPNVCMSGFTIVGNENLFGINSATIPGIKIGNRNKIAAGMIVDQNVGDDTVVFYRFKERIIAVPKK